MDNDRIVQVNGVSLCLEAFGDPTDPAVLLIAGANSSMDWWPALFCQRLAAGARHVIRYDQRDTGRSVSYPQGEPGYGADDLIADVVGILDELELLRAHIVGISTGGAIAQLVALTHRDRVLSLTLISTSAGPGDPDLPGMTDELRSTFEQESAEPDWTDRDAVVDYVVEQARP